MIDQEMSGVLGEGVNVPDVVDWLLFSPIVVSRAHISYSWVFL